MIKRLKLLMLVLLNRHAHTGDFLAEKKNLKNNTQNTYSNK